MIVTAIGRSNHFSYVTARLQGLQSRILAFCKNSIALFFQNSKLKTLRGPGLQSGTNWMCFPILVTTFATMDRLIACVCYNKDSN